MAGGVWTYNLALPFDIGADVAAMINGAQDTNSSRISDEPGRQPVHFGALHGRQLYAGS